MRYNVVKRLLHIVANVATLSSLIVCLGTVVMWARSYSYVETLHWFGNGRELSLISARGQFDWYKVWASSLGSWPTEFNIYRRPASSGLDGRVTVLQRQRELSHFGPTLGFALFWDAHPSYGELFIETMIPWWAITLMAAGLPAIWLRRWRKRRATVRAGCCVICGYDLRATPDRCPECGEVPAGPVGVV